MGKNILFFLMVCLLQVISANEFLIADDSKNVTSLKACIIREEQANEMLEKVVGNILANNYFTTTMDAGNADMLIKLNCRINKSESLVKGDMYDFKEYFTTVGIQVVNAYNSQVLFDYLLSNHRTLSPVSSSETSSQNNAIRDILKPLEKELDKKLKNELPQINKLVAQSKPKSKPKTASYVASSQINIPRTTISPLRFDEEAKITSLPLSEVKKYKLDKILSSELLKGKVNRKQLYKGTKGTIDYAIIFIPDQMSQVLLVSYDNAGTIIAFQEIATSIFYAGDYMDAVFEKNKFTTTYKWCEPGSASGLVTVNYTITEKLQFIEENRNEEYEEYKEENNN